MSLTKPPVGSLLNRAHPLAQGLVGAWLLRERGGICNDASGNGTTMALTNMDPGTDWVPGPTGLALDFDGANDYLLASKQPPTCLSAITIAWHGYVSNNTVGDASARIVDWYPAPSIYRGQTINPNLICWYGNIGGSSRDFAISTSTFTDAWHTCAVTFDGLAVRVYIDGVLDKTDTSYSGALSAPTNTFCISGRSTGTDRCLAATMSWVMMWDRALTPAKVLSLTDDPYAMFRPAPVWRLYPTSITDYPVSLADTLSLSDVLTPLCGYLAILADSLTLADAITPLAAYSVSIADSLSAADAITALGGYRATLSDGLTLADGLWAAAGYLVQIADALGLGDALSVAAAYQASLSDTLALSDALTALYAATVALSDALSLSDAMTASLAADQIERLTIILRAIRDTIVLNAQRQGITLDARRDTIRLNNEV